MRETPLPDDLKSEISAGYQELTKSMGAHAAVRSSAISEDGSAASFAGLYESYLNMVGDHEVLDAVHRCYVSLWSERAISYRAGRGDGADEAMAVVVMKLVPSETAGIAFTAHPVTGSLDQVIINASFGLGETIVSGRVTPDSFLVDKNSFTILEREIYAKELALYPHEEGGGGTSGGTPAARPPACRFADGRAGLRRCQAGGAGRKALRLAAGHRMGTAQRDTLFAAVPPDHDSLIRSAARR